MAVRDVLTIAQRAMVAGAIVYACACTNTPTTPTSQTKLSAPVAQLKRTKFMAFGDSITAGEVTVPVTGVGPILTPSFKLVQVLSAAYPTVLESLLVSRYSSQSSVIFVANEGKGAEQVEFALERFNKAFDADRPDVVLLMEGYNDICCGNGEVGVNKTDVGVNTVGSEARNRGARVFMATLAPSKPGSKFTPLEVIQAANDRIRNAARGEGAYLVDVYSALLPDVNANIGIDGLHPTEVGYRRIAETFFAAIQADLEVH